MTLKDVAKESSAKSLQIKESIAKFREKREEKKRMTNFFRDKLSTDARFFSTEIFWTIDLLEPKTAEAVQAIIADAAAMNIDLMVFETYRSKARQAQLFAQGATKLQTVGVHHYGLAADIVKKLPNGQPSWDGDFSFLGTLAKKHGLIWGGDWGQPNIAHAFVDADHVQRVSKKRQNDLFSGIWYPDDTYNPYEDL